MLLSTHNRAVIGHYLGTTFLYNYFCSPKEGHVLHYGLYDKEHKTYLQAAENSTRMLAKLVHLTSFDKVLDAGCGVGGTAIWIAKNKGARVVGINIVPQQKFYISKKAGYMNKRGIKNNLDAWRISLTHSKSITKLIQKTKPYLKHKEKIKKISRFSTPPSQAQKALSFPPLL